jgi:glucose-6-phosphate-specific signal transduction histidine kinase
LLRESVLKAELSERKRIARDLHDNIGSHLAYLVGGLEQAARDHQNEKLNQLEHFGRDAITQLRETIWAIQSNNTEILSFVDRVREMARRYHHHLHVEFINKIPFTATHKLSALQTLYLFRIIQKLSQMPINNHLPRFYCSKFLFSQKVYLPPHFAYGMGYEITKATVGNGLKIWNKGLSKLVPPFASSLRPAMALPLKYECRLTQF